MLWKSKKRSLHYFFTHPPEEYAAGQFNHSLIMSFLIKSFSDFVGENTDLKGISFVWRIFSSCCRSCKATETFRKRKITTAVGKAKRPEDLEDKRSRMFEKSEATEPSQERKITTAVGKAK